MCSARTAEAANGIRNQPPCERFAPRADGHLLRPKHNVGMVMKARPVRPDRSGFSLMAISNSNAVGWDGRLKRGQSRSLRLHVLPVVLNCAIDQHQPSMLAFEHSSRDGLGTFRHEDSTRLRID